MTSALRLSAPWRVPAAARFLILARVSTTKQDSEAQQLDKCRAYIRDVLHGKDADITVREDHGVSGLDERRLEEIVTACEGAPGTEAAPKSILVYDGSRFSRLDSEAVAFYKYRLRRAHWRVSSVTEHDSGDVGMDNTMGAMRQEFGHAAHSRMLKLKVPDGMRASAALGCWTGRPPFGYVVPKGQERRTQKLVIVTDDARTVVRIFTRYAEGATPASIAAELHAAQVPGPFTRYPTSHPHASGKWRACTIRDMLRKEAYLGVVVWNDVRVEGAHEAIIDRKLWNAVQARLSRKEPRRHTSNPQPYMLTGLLTCETCGGGLVGSGGGHGNASDPYKFRVYSCLRSKREVRTCEGPTLYVNQRWLEGTVCEHVGAQIAAAVASGALAKALDRALGTRTDTREPRADLEKQRDALKARKLSLMEYKSDADAKARVAELNAAIAQVEGELSALRLVPKRSELLAERERLLKLAANLPAVLAKATPTERRELLAPWVAEVRLNKVKRTGAIALRPVPAASLLYNDGPVSLSRAGGRL
jgi:DNA invertase Pin-like site-specific DNA recombinase